jgi:nicotinamide-nucleotide amidase
VASVGTTVVAVLPDAADSATPLAETHLLPRVPRRATEPAVLVRTLRLVGPAPGDAEAQLAAALRGIEGATARVAEAGGEVWVRLALRAATPAAVERRFDDLAPALRAALGAAWYGVDDETLPAVVGRLLKGRGLTLALAESCTGGLVGHRVTDVPGSSAYFERGFVAYSNAAKHALLGVPEGLLARHGAVSAECAEAMARGARVQAGTDLGLSVTGIAGPEGGTPTKPVGRWAWSSSAWPTRGRPSSSGTASTGTARATRRWPRCAPSTSCAGTCSAPAPDGAGRARAVSAGRRARRAARRRRAGPGGARPWHEAC